ncbi:nucleolar protein 12-like [Macrobrachium rosenbergii]|uniref:nucleolar protein 12-like n=1 Tax=Macrobrachium rosenbergii TaxID=79674 RepID=UPI0034D5F311
MLPKSKSKFRKGPDQGAKAKKPKNRKSKLVIKFDATDRKNYLKGFQKRKEERRKKAFEQMQLDLKHELQQMRKDRRKMMKKMVHQGAPDDMMIGLTKKVVTSCGSATVEFTEIDFTSKNQSLLGENSFAEEQENAAVGSESDEDIPMYSKDQLEELGILSQKDLKRSVRQSAARAMKASKLMQRREKRHAREQRKTQRRLNNEKSKKKTKGKNHKRGKPKEY